MDIVMNERVEDFVFARRTVQACFRDHYDPAQPDVLRRKTIDFMVSSQEAKSVIVYAVYTGPDFVRQGMSVVEIAMRILGSAVIY
jgi:hypothetical protein